MQDTEKRNIYDQFGEEGLKGAGGGGNPFAHGFPGGGFRFQTSGFPGGENIFRQFFSMGDDDDDGFFHNMHSKRERAQASTLVSHELHVTLEELYMGSKRKMKVTSRSLQGRLSEKILNIEIQPGWKDGTKLKFPNEGDEVGPGVYQIVEFVLKEKPHPKFTRSGSNLSTTLEVNLLEALTGFEKDLVTIDNRRILARGDSVVYPGQILVIRGEGMPISRNPGSKGDLHVKISVRFPKNLPADSGPVLRNVFRDARY